QWYTDAVIWASANDIVSGYGDGRFGGGDSITREQLAAIIYRYSRMKGLYTVTAAELVAYSDAEQISGWARDAMEWAVANGLITGRTQTTLAPAGTATRAEAAAILQRFIEWSEDNE
ncbi:MAG: S-layer homology domain-containing protein, partial [Defluviitaleaceae bacterium]|nr:S-layer homology domain-containing protein [Defluviitaleaceae bacterium]